MSKTHLPKVIAGDNAILARRYASALFSSAEEQKAVEVVEADLNDLLDGMCTNKHFHAMAAHPRLQASEVARIMKAMAEKVGLHALTESLLTELAMNRRLVLFADIVDAFLTDLDIKRNVHAAKVTAANALSAAQQTKLAAQLSKMVGGTVRLVVEEDKDLLGGFVVKVGSRLIDASVKGKLARIERQMKLAGEAA